jgi:hypothetical protein
VSTRAGCFDDFLDRCEETMKERRGNAAAGKVIREAHVEWCEGKRSVSIGAEGDGFACSPEAALEVARKVLELLGAPPRPALTPRQRRAMRAVLMRYGSLTSHRFDQALRHDVGDEDADEVMRWVERELDLTRNEEKDRWESGDPKLR